MSKTHDQRVDQYISKAQPFAQPILNHLRKLVHQTTPEVTETIKWGVPHFEYKGILCFMAAFKQHAIFGFWQSSLIPEVQKRKAKGKKNDGMGGMGKLTSLDDLPSDAVLKKMIKQAVQLKDKGIKLPPKPKKPKRPIHIPKDFAQALIKHTVAGEVFEGLSYSHRKEYIEWITEAKKEDTRQRRIESALDMLAERKTRNSKYQK